MFDRARPTAPAAAPAPEFGLPGLSCRNASHNAPLRSVRLGSRPFVVPTPSFSLLAKTALCAEVRAHGFFHFDRLAEYLAALPFGRPQRADDPLAVLREGRGTCASKHRLLAELAHACGHEHIELRIGVYEMNGRNTPGAGPVLEAAGHTTLVDTRCHLVIGAQRLDFSGLGRGGEASPLDALLCEHRASPAELATTHDRVLREALTEWATTRGLTPGSARALREACLAALVATSAGAPRR